MNIPEIPRAGGWTVKVVLVLVVPFLALQAVALTVRTKSDLRHWETVTDRASPLSWTWEPTADAARLTFSNRLTRAVASVDAVRADGERCGACAHPIAAAGPEGFVVATLTQLSNGVAVACGTAELAYVPGAGTNRPIAVRTKAARAWRRVECPRLAAFDARWWNVAGPSGYEILWVEPPGPHRVGRAFGGAGVVDEVVLKFGLFGLVMALR